MAELEEACGQPMGRETAGDRANRLNMNPLVLAVIPAFLGSLFLMYQGGASQAQMLQQVGVFVVAGVLCAVVSRKPVVLKESVRNRLLAGAVLALLATLLLMPGEGPHRWIGVGGFRLYIASVVLPGTLLLLAQTVHSGTARPGWSLAILIATAAALAAQPDASQATAFALACLAFLLRAPLSLLARAGGIIALVAATVVVWMRPDPLQPVPYVEGVLDLALVAGPLALAVALLFLALPIAGLLHLSRISSDRFGIIAVAVYYVSVMFFAYRQLTPMPVLGFGVGPILGYLGMAALVGGGKNMTTSPDDSRKSDQV